MYKESEALTVYQHLLDLLPPVTGLLSISYWSGDNKTTNLTKKI